MERGFDSYKPDEALRQAEARGERIFVERLVGIPGTAGEFVRLTMGCGLIAWLVGSVSPGNIPYLHTPTGLLLAIFVTMMAGPIGLMAGDRFAPSFSSRLLRRLAWALVSAATFLLVVRLGLAVLMVAIFRLQGMGEQAGQEGFVGAAWFSLMIAIPGWALWLIWSFLRLPPPRHARSPLLNGLAALALVVGAMVLLGSEGAYFDGLHR